jgi:ATP-binding cassette, subfamily B, bacterial
MKKKLNTQTRKKEISLIRRSLIYARPYRVFIFIIFLLTVVATAASAIEPLIMKYIFDNISSGDSASLLLKGVGAFFILMLLREAAVSLGNYFTWRTRITMQVSLQDAMVEKIHKLPHEHLRNEGVGAVMTKLDRSISGFIGALNELSFNVIPSILYLSIALVVMFQLNTYLALVAVIFTPVPALISHFAVPKQIKREKILFKKWARIYSRFNEVLSGIVTVRSFAMEDYEKYRFMNYIKDTNRIVIRGLKYDNTTSFFQNITVLIARAVVLGAGIYLVVNGKTTIGTLIAFLAYIGGLFGPVQGLTGIYKTIRLASVSLEQVFSVLDNQDYLGDEPGAIEADRFSGEVNFNNVHFYYHATGNKILSGIDLKVRAGEMIAVVGPSGSGKSTMMALLMRFYDPVSGSIQIDGMNLRSLKQNSLRKQIGVVLQDALLFNESVRDNIAYGRPSASMEEIIDAAKKANAHDFILKLKNGYNTLVGEKGGLLSVGERQRVSIARAILKNPSIMIFDEATSSLDAELEAQVQDAIEKLMHNRTTFVIAHRLSTVVNADRIIVLKEGQIIETGTHHELILNNGYYKFLVNKQIRGLSGTELPAA